jgi:hypothetical protein
MKHKPQINISSSTPITCNPKILNTIVNIQTDAYLKGLKNISSNLIDELTLLFGDSNKTLRLEYLTKVWIVEYNDVSYNIFTAKGKGTSIEIIGYDFNSINSGVKEKEIIDFIEHLYKEINNI